MTYNQDNIEKVIFNVKPNIVYTHYYNDLNINDKPNQAIMAEIRLNGLGSDSGRLTRLLADKVLGFEPTQTAWKD